MRPLPFQLISLYPEYAGEDNAYRLLAEAHRNLGETEEERDALGKLAAISCDAIQRCMFGSSSSAVQLHSSLSPVIRVV